MFLCVSGHGGRGARLATVSLARWTSLSHRPMHARPAWRWSVCARSVHGHVASAVVVLAVCGRVSRLLGGLFGVRSLSSQRVLAQSDLLCAGVPLVAMLVGARCVGPAWYVCTVRRPPAAGVMQEEKTTLKSLQNSFDDIILEQWVSMHLDHPHNGQYVRLEKGVYHRRDVGSVSASVRRTFSISVL